MFIALGVMVFVILVAITVPVGVAIGLATLATAIFHPYIPPLMIPARMINVVDSFVLMAVPLFLVAGTLMETGGIAKRLLALATVLVGHVKGAFGMVAVVAEMFFSGISGSTVADVSAMSSMLLPSMKRAGYKPAYSVAIISAASAMGILIPPCILMVVLGALINVSIAALFFGGFLPALVLAILLMAILYYQARVLDLPAGERATPRQALSALADSLIPFGMPLIIFGGILGGVFSPTEAAAVAVVYALVVGLFVYRELTWRKAWEHMVNAGVLVGTIMAVVTTAAAFSYTMSIERVPAMLSAALLAVSDSPLFFLMVSNIIFIFFSDVLDGLPVMIIFVPILAPLAVAFNVDMLHWGILVIASIGIGTFLPPGGVGVIVAAAVGQVPMHEVTKPLLPLIGMLCVGLVFLTLFPQISTIVPRLLTMW